MSSYNGRQESQVSGTIQPYYVRGDVFQRDQRYYDQVINTRRNRTPIKGNSSVEASNIINQSRFQGSNPIINQSINSQGYQINPTSATITNSLNPQHIQSSYTNVAQDQQETRRLIQQNAALTSELKQLTTGGDFGTSDTVIKMGHYTASKAENATIRQQQLKIKSLQEEVSRNNEKLIKYQKAASQLQTRMNNIQAIDKQIYKQLKSASTRDKQLLEKASSALARGQTRESVMRILEQIVLS